MQRAGFTGYILDIPERIGDPLDELSPPKWCTGMVKDSKETPPFCPGCLYTEAINDYTIDWVPFILRYKITIQK